MELVELRVGELKEVKVVRCPINYLTFTLSVLTEGKSCPN